MADFFRHFVKLHIFNFCDCMPEVLILRKCLSYRAAALLQTNYYNFIFKDVCDCSRPSTSRGFNNNGYVNNNDSNINNNNENQRNLNTNNNESQTDSMAVPSVQSRWRFTYPLATRHFPLINQSIIRSSGSGSQSENAQRQSSQSQASTSSSNQSEVTINQSMPYDPPPYSP